eukprot:tig00000553_g2101.t1
MQLLACLRLGTAELPAGVNGALCNSASRPAAIPLAVGSYVLYTFKAALECQEFNFTLAGGFVATFSIEDVYAVPLGYHRYEIYSVMGASDSFPTNQVDSTVRGTGASSAKTTASAELRRCGANTLAGLTRFAVLNTDQTNSGMQFNYTVSIRPCQGIITGIVPLDGPRVGGNLVTLTGEDILTWTGDLVEASSSFHDRPLRQADLLSVSADRSTVVLRVPAAPFGAPARHVNVTVVSSFHGRSVSPPYDLNPELSFESIEPRGIGPPIGGNLITVRGYGFIHGDVTLRASIGNASDSVACPSVEVLPPEIGEAYSRAAVVTVPPLRAPLREDYAYDVLFESVRSGASSYREAYTYTYKPKPIPGTYKAASSLTISSACTFFFSVYPRRRLAAAPALLAASGAAALAAACSTLAELPRALAEIGGRLAEGYAALAPLRELDAAGYDWRLVPGGRAVVTLSSYRRRCKYELSLPLLPGDGPAAVEAAARAAAALLLPPPPRSHN